MEGLGTSLGNATIHPSSRLQSFAALVEELVTSVSSAFREKIFQSEIDILSFNRLAQDCKHRRPGQAFNKVGNTAPEVLDKEYESFLSDLEPSRKVKKKEEAPYVPPMGDLSNALKGPSTPLMLTNGSSAPGAASAYARAVSSGQTPGGMLQVMGKSIFGGKLTRLTSGYKSQAELEMEKKKKKEEYDNRPVPLEWQVERFENQLNKQQDSYLKALEKQAEDERKRKETQQKLLNLPPPPPPPLSSRRPSSSSASSSSSDPSIQATLDLLPNLIGTPLNSLRK